MLKQWVPSEVCLRCEGCCRFQSTDSPWRPRMGAAEKAALSQQIGEDFIDDASYVKAISDCGNVFCQFFKRQDSTCQIYTQRPFECTLYPFILSQSTRGLKIYVHLSCPYVQDHQGDESINSYIAYLKEFFNHPSTRDFLSRNKSLVHDYTPFEDELLFLFELEKV